MSKSSISKWLKEGEQSKITKNIKEISSKFKGNDLEKVVQIMNWISQKIKPINDYREIIKVFAKRTANKIIRDGWHTGCHDTALLFVTFSRAVEIPSKYVVGINKIYPESSGHCIAEVSTSNKWYSVDPSIGKICIRMDKDDFYRNNYVVGKGIDSWDIGIKTFKDWKNQSDKIIKKTKQSLPLVT